MLFRSLFETHRNDGAGLRSRRRQDGNQASKLIRNEFGGSAGGPVYLPSLYDGRNKSFWFFAYEAQRLRATLFQQDRVPTLEMWNGDFSRVIDAANRQTHIYDPLTTDAQGVRTQFDNNLIPRIRLHPFYATMRSVSHLPHAAHQSISGCEPAAGLRRQYRLQRHHHQGRPPLLGS